LDILKYRLTKLGNEPLKTSPLERILRFPRRGGIYDPNDAPSIIYTTPTELIDSNCARAALGITYFPGVRYLVDPLVTTNGLFDIRTNEGDVITNCSNRSLDSIPPVWPAFGQAGGARELLLIPKTGDREPVPIPTLKETPILGGGAPSLWHQDDVAAYHGDYQLSIFGIGEGLARATFLAIADQNGEQPRNRGPPSSSSPLGDGDARAVLVKDGGAVVRTPLLGNSGSKRWVSVSAAIVKGRAGTYRALHWGSGVLALRFWVAIWEDQPGMRYLLDDAIEPLDSFLPRPFHRIYGFSLAASAARALLNHAAKVSDKFFESHARIVPLAP
jgi:hypothetical protein